MPLTSIIGTGRCGSTMLSGILRRHPDVLSLSEFWNVFLELNDGLLTPKIPVHDMTGEEYWQRIASCRPYDADGLHLMWLKTFPKVSPSGGRFGPATGVPPICWVLLNITSDFEAVYDKLAVSVPSWPRRPMAEHCRALFADLATMFDRRAIVERTGGSALLTPILRQQFPESRFVFLHRDGPDSALSMSRHHDFRLSAVKLALRDLRDVGNLSAADMPLPPEIRESIMADLKGLIEPPFDAERFESYPLSVSFFGWLWSLMTVVGIREMSEIPHDRVMTLRYELLLKEPRAELTRLANFIGVPAGRQWLDEAEKVVDSGRSGKAVTKLHPSALAELRASCASGTRAYELLESRQAAAPNASTGDDARP